MQAALLIEIKQYTVTKDERVFYDLNFLFAFFSTKHDNTQPLAKFSVHRVQSHLRVVKILGGTMQES